MKRHWGSIACLVALLACVSASARPPLSDAQLLRILPPAEAVRGGFDAVEEWPTDPANDPDLHRWGVRAQRARHYTRDTRTRADGIQVCSVEVWAFDSVARARDAHAAMAYPGWEFAHRGKVVLLARGLTRPPNKPPRRAVFDDCRRILQAAASRAPIR